MAYLIQRLGLDDVKEIQGSWAPEFRGLVGIFHCYFTLRYGRSLQALVKGRIIIGRREPASLEGKCINHDSSIPSADQLLLPGWWVSRSRLLPSWPKVTRNDTLK